MSEEAEPMVNYDSGVELHTSNYSRLQQHAAPEDLDLEEFEAILLPNHPLTRRVWWWAKVFIWSMLAAAVIGVLAIWLFPFLLDKVVIPLMGWETRTFTRPVLALVLIGSLAFSPVILMPSGPSMWLAGMTFGYGYGFLIIMVGTLIGISIPFFIARMLFQARIQQWIQKWPKRAALIRIADKGGWFEQFRVLLILRISPIPYPLFNYAIATTNVEYGPYICSSAAILVPEAFITIYSGKLIKTLADMKNSRQHMTPLQIAYNVLGFCMAVAVTIAITIHGKRALQELELKEHIGKEEESELPCRPDADYTMGECASDGASPYQPEPVFRFREEQKD